VTIVDVLWWLVGVLAAALGLGMRYWLKSVDTSVKGVAVTVSSVSERVAKVEVQIPHLVEDVRQVRAANERFHEFAFSRLGAPASVGPYSVPKEPEREAKQ